MTEIIQDGLGAGWRMQVDASYRARILSDSRDESAYDNQQGRVFAASWSAITPTAGTSVLVWLGNNLTNNVNILGAEVVVAGAETLSVYTDSVAALSACTFAAPIPMNTVSQFALPLATAATSTGTVAFAYANSAITGTGSGSLVGILSVTTAKEKGFWTPCSRVILGPGKALFLKTALGNLATTGIIYFSIEPGSALTVPR